MAQLTKKNKVILEADIIQKIDTDLYTFANDEAWPRVWHLYDYQKEIKFPGEYETVWPFYNEVGCVKIRGRYNFVNREGKLLFAVHFSDVEETLFKECIMNAYIGKKCIRIALTGDIDMSKREIAKTILKET